MTIRIKHLDVLRRKQDAYIMEDSSTMRYSIWSSYFVSCFSGKTIPYIHLKKLYKDLCDEYGFIDNDH